MKLNLKEHSRRGARFIIATSLIGLSSYIITILFVDYFEFPFYIVGLFITPYSLILRYIASDKWVWKKNE